MVRALTAVFWAALLLFVVWVALSEGSNELLPGLLGDNALRLGAVLEGIVWVSSGLLLLHHKRAKGGDEDYWTGAETFYAIVFAIATFFAFYYLAALFFSF